jgi:colanic acid biosynthesis glycosyl transferase WcaI
MNVLVIAQLFPPDMGGGATRAQNVANGLISLGHKVVVVAAFPNYPTGKTPKEYRHKLLAVERSGKLGIFRTWVPSVASKGFLRRLFLICSFSISSLLAMPLVGHVDIVWAANPNIFSVFPAMVYGAWKHCPIVQNVDDLWPEEVVDLRMIRSGFLRRLAESVSRFAYAKSSAITPISPAYTNVIVKKYRISPKKVHLVYAGVDLSKFDPQEDRLNRERSGRTFKILYIGALSLAYNFDQVLESAKLLSANDSIEFVIQGGGELGPALKSKVKEMRLSNVKVKLQIVSRDKVPKILSGADVLILPLSGLKAVEMGISSKLYEYQASGRPIICCSGGQPAKYISKTKSGIVVKPGDSKGLARAILYLHKNRRICEKLGSAGRSYVEDNLSSEKIALKMEGIFNTLLTTTRSS